MAKRKASTDLHFYELQSPDLQVDFKRLRTGDAAFRQIWDHSNGKLNFKDPHTCITLTKATLKQNFNLQLELPDDRLCPPVPNRWSYVTWIQGLIDSTSPTYSEEYDPERKIVGLDVGTGASAIYALLFLKSRPRWKMCVTEIDGKSFDFAAKNLALNNMLTRTTMLQTTESMDIIPLHALADRLDFVVCNPPFFDNEDEMRASMEGDGKSAKPNAVCTGSTNEMVCSGGDLAFVSKMVQESVVLRDKVAWYSSMLGKKSSVHGIVELLKQNGIANWAVGCLAPGNTTKRWVVAWSFGDMRPRNVRHVSLNHQQEQQLKMACTGHRPHQRHRERPPPLPNAMQHPPLRGHRYGHCENGVRDYARCVRSALALGLEYKHWYWGGGAECVEPRISA